MAWRRLLAPAAVVILAVGAVSGGIALIGAQRGSSGLVEFLDGPSADMRTLDAQEFAFDFPADWHAYDSSAVGSGISSIAVLGTQPVEPRCGDDRHVDINCVNERRLEPGEIRMLVSTGAYQSGSFKDRPSITNGRTVRLEIDGQVAIVDDVEAAGDDYYGATESLHLYIERPVEANQIVMIDIIARDHGSDEILRRMQQVIDTFRFDASAFPSPSDWWASREAVGLPVISVSDAIAIRDAGIDAREIAVHGWFWPVAPIPCPLPPPTSLEPVCLDQYVVLMAEPESLGTGGSNGYSGDRPTGPSFQIDLDDLDSAWQPALPASQPVEIAVVGHFDDRGSTSCSPEQQDACRDRFVVDRVDWVNGETLPTSIVDYLEGTGMPFDEAQGVIDVVRPGITVLSAAHAFGGFDPRRIDHSFVDPPRWIVRVLDHGALATYMVVDSTGSIYEITADGPVLVALSTPGEPASPEPSPIPRVRSTFTIEVGPIDTTVSVEVIDRTGFLDVARAATAAELARETRIIGPGGLALWNLAPDTVLVTWTGTVCDAHPRLTIDSSVPDGPPRDLRLTDEHPGCDTLGIGRAVVLRFSRDTDARDLVGTEDVQLLAESPPEPNTIVVELQRGDSTESVLVIDHAASLMEARAANPVPPISEFTGVRIVRADDRGTIVLWNGALCDRDLWISIDADELGPPDRIVVHGTHVEPCRAMLVQRAIWLDLGPVDVASIRGQLAVGAPTSAKRDAGPVIGVAEALVIRSHPADDHQLQVRGWYWRDPAVYDCSVPPSPPPALESGCQGPRDRFVADPEDLTGPGFVVWLRPGIETSSIRYGDPSEAVIVGHFGDTLAEACAAAMRDSCRDVFVVEEVLPAPAP